MRPGQLHPNELELAVLERIARDEPRLHGPFASLRVLSREYTGVSGYTNFLCEVPEQPGDAYAGLKPLLHMPGVANGMGVIVWCRGTQPHHLELFVHGDGYWDGTFEGFSFIDAGA